jgi:hypothetical protein
MDNPYDNVIEKEAKSQTLQALLQNRLPCPFVTGWHYSTMGLDLWYRIPEFVLNATWLEEKHDYVQYLLPTDKPSEYNLHVGTVPVSSEYPLHVNPAFYYNPKTAINMKSAMRANILRGATMMLKFFGIKTTLNWPNYIGLEIANPLYSTYGKKTFKVWNKDDGFVKNIKSAPHNDLRITRLIRCLRLFGFHQLALRALYLLNYLLEFVGRFEHLEQYKHYDLSKTPMANKYLAEEYVILATIMDAAKEAKHSLNDLSDLDKHDYTSLFGFVEDLNKMQFVTPKQKYLL